MTMQWLLYGANGYTGELIAREAAARGLQPILAGRNAGKLATLAGELGLPLDIINVDGGAIAHGHPIGATGAVLTTRLLYSMRADGIRRGIVTLCIGGGQGIALALEALD